MMIECETCGGHDMTGRTPQYIGNMISLHVPLDLWPAAIASAEPSQQSEIRAELKVIFRRNPEVYQRSTRE